MSYKLVPPEQVRYTELSPRDLVDLLAYKVHRLQAIRALIAGLDHPNPKVRLWCLQLLDHVGDAPCFEQIVHALDDPVPRVRAMALHALECERCKQSPALVAAARETLARQAARFASVETAGYVSGLLQMQ